MRPALLAALPVVLALLGSPAISGERGSSLSQPQNLAPGIYVVPAEAGAPNGANIGVIVGPAGAVVVGTGGSAAQGEALLAAIARLTDQPVVLGINAYAGPEHVLGNSVLARRGIPVLAHRATDAYMAANCETCLENLRSQVGDVPLAGSRPERPGRLIDGSMILAAGGRRLELLHYGPAQQPGSIAVLDAESGVLFAGALADFGVVPDARDADLASWIAALEQMGRLPLKSVVPARGPVGGPARLAETRDYLADLKREVEEAYDRGLSLFEAVRAIDLPRYSDWALYPGTHTRNVHFQYLRREARDFSEVSP